jgi:16S rRNA G527 N7-methylase RsmG
VSSRRNILSASQRNPVRIWEHIYDSLNALHLLACDPAKKCLDIGSGNGLPAIPLAVALPAVEFVLVEQSDWRADYLLYVSSLLKLRNVRVLNKSITRGLILLEDPDAVTLRALVSAGRVLRVEWLQALRCSVLIFATATTEQAWRRNLVSANMHVVARYEYCLESRGAPRVLLKFSRS